MVRPPLERGSRDHDVIGGALTINRASASPPRRRSVAIAVAAVLAVCGAIVSASDVLLSGAPAAALGAPTFVEETAGAGIDQLYAGGFDYAVGGGVAVFDCNGDGKPDLYLAGGSAAAALYRNDSPVGSRACATTRRT